MSMKKFAGGLATGAGVLVLGIAFGIGNGVVRHGWPDDWSPNKTMPDFVQDPATGCHYIVSPAHGTFFPRLTAEGRQLCTEPERR